MGHTADWWLRSHKKPGLLALGVWARQKTLGSIHGTPLIRQLPTEGLSSCPRPLDPQSAPFRPQGAVILLRLPLRSSHMCFCAHDPASFKFQASGEATSSPHSGNLFEAHTSKDELRIPWYELTPHSTHIALTETTSSCIHLSASLRHPCGRPSCSLVLALCLEQGLVAHSRHRMITGR